MPLAGIHPCDGGTLTIVTNKCSIVRNAPCRMNMHPPRCLDPCPLLLPRSELHRRHPPARHSPPLRTYRSTPILLEVHERGAGFMVAGATAITPSAWIQSVSYAAFHWSLARTTVIFISSVQATRWVVCCVSQIKVRVLYPFDFAIHQELWILSFPQGISLDAQGCWRHCFSTVKLSRRSRWSNWFCGMSNWERWAEASTGGQAEEESTGEKMDNVIWKMNLIIVDVVCVVFGCLLWMYVAKK
jgi:hypothetical protein